MTGKATQRPKILLFGGSFDPPHRGHLALLKAALQTLRPERAYLLPAWRSPLKEPAAAPAAARLELLRLALRDDPDGLEGADLRIDDFELRRGRTTFTFEAVRELQRRHPEAQLLFLAGSDALRTLPRWRRIEELRRSCVFAAGLRPGCPLPSGEPATILKLPGLFPDISSTAVRLRLLCGRDVSGLLAPAVQERIRALGLYGAGLQKLLERELPPKRFRHTLGVARIASELAGLHGLEPERAALTGLLHDCARGLDSAQLIRYTRAHDLRIPAFDEIARRKPALLHAYVGADLCSRRFNIKDPEILSAVRKHTLGDPKMSAFDRLLYVSDACSEDRRYKEAQRIQRLARRSLQAGFRETVRVKLAWVLRSSDWMHPFGPALWNQAISK